MLNPHCSSCKSTCFMSQLSSPSETASGFASLAMSWRWRIVGVHRVQPRRVCTMPEPRSNGRRDLQWVWKCIESGRRSTGWTIDFSGKTLRKMPSLVWNQEFQWYLPHISRFPRFMFSILWAMPSPLASICLNCFACPLQSMAIELTFYPPADMLDDDKETQQHPTCVAPSVFT